MNSLKTALLSIILLFLAVSTLFSQKKNTLDISIGASLPVGSFASSSIASGSMPSSTGTGLFIDVTFKKNISISHFAVAGLLGLNTNGFNADTVVENYKENKPNFQWSEQNSNWITVVAMPGICYYIPIYKKIGIYAGLFVGAGVVRSPSYTLIGVRPTLGFESNARANQESSWDVTITGRLTAGIQFATGKKTKFVIQSGYSYLKPTFQKILQTYYENKGIIGTPERDITITSTEFSFTQNMRILNIGACFIVEL